MYSMIYKNCESNDDGSEINLNATFRRTTPSLRND